MGSRKPIPEAAEGGAIERIIGHFRELEEVTPDIIFLLDREYVIRYANRTAAGLLKKNIRQVIGKYLDLFFPPPAYRTQFQRLAQVFASGSVATSTGRISIAGSDRLLNTKLVPIRDLSGTIAAVLTVSRDLSELSMTGAAEAAVLSERESQVLNLVAEGKTNREIGETLFISPKTVDVHRTRIMKKLDAHNTAELILKSRQTGLLV